MIFWAIQPKHSIIGCQYQQDVSNGWTTGLVDWAMIGQGAARISGYPLKGPNSHMGIFWRQHRETYTFLKALELLISKMYWSRANNYFPQRNSNKIAFFSENINAIYNFNFPTLFHNTSWVAKFSQLELITLNLEVQNWSPMEGMISPACHQVHTHRFLQLALPSSISLDSKMQVMQKWYYFHHALLTHLTIYKSLLFMQIVPDFQQSKQICAQPTGIKGLIR